MTGTTIVDNRPVDTRLTANALLFGTGTRSAEALGQAMSDHHAARTALRSTRRLSVVCVARTA